MKYSYTESDNGIILTGPIIFRVCKKFWICWMQMLFRFQWKGYVMFWLVTFRKSHCLHSWNLAPQNRALQFWLVSSNKITQLECCLPVDRSISRMEGTRNMLCLKYLFYFKKKGYRLSWREVGWDRQQKFSML